VKRTNPNNFGQVYVPEVNYFYMIVIVLVLIAYQNTTNLGNAYGIAVATAMCITTVIYSFIIVFNFGKHVAWAVLFFLFFGLIDFSFLAANLLKFAEGGWFTVVLMLLGTVTLCVWRWGRIRMQVSKASLFTCPLSEFFQASAPAIRDLNVVKERVCICYSAVATDVPPAYVHFLRCVPAIPRFTVFVHIRPVNEAVVRRRIEVEAIQSGNDNLRIFRCVIDNGYKQVAPDAGNLAEAIVRRLGPNFHYFFLVSQDFVLAPPHSGRWHKFLVLLFEGLLSLSRSGGVKSFGIPPENCLDVGIKIPIQKVHKD